MVALTEAAPGSTQGPAPSGGTASYATAQALGADAAPHDGEAPEQVRGGGAPIALSAKDCARVPLVDDGHVAMAVALDVCSHCGLCVPACGEVQVNDVIGMSGREADAYPTFDFADPMGESTCVACGERVRACPTGALLEAPVAALADGAAHDAETRTVCPFCGVGCQVSLRTLGDRPLSVDGIDGPANEGRLCVKGRFGVDYVHHPDRLTVPLIRRDDAPAKGMDVDPSNPLTHFREATRDEAPDAAAAGLRGRGREVAGFGSAKCTDAESYLFQKLIRQGFGYDNVDHCTRLCHASSVAALMENVGSAAVAATSNEIEHADVAIVIGANPVENHAVAGTYFEQFAKHGGTLIVMDPRGQALRRHAAHMLQFRPGADVALLNAICHVIVEEELYDRRYTAGYTGNWEAERPHLGGFARERMAEITGIDPKTVRAVAPALAGGQAGRDDLLGHWHLAARPRHRQLALPDLAGAPMRSHGAARHELASAQGAEQRAGGQRRGADPDVPVRLPLRARRGRAGGHGRAPGRGRGARPYAGAGREGPDRHRDHGRHPCRRHPRDVHTR